MDREGGVVVIGRAEIDTRPPFRSVKEAVMLFGEKVLVAEVYASKIKEMQIRTSESGSNQAKFRAVTNELDETKQSLEKAREEGNIMANCLKSLREELEQTKEELRQLKAREIEKQPLDPEIEDLKFIENATNTKPETPSKEDDEFQEKRYVRFASPPSLAKIIASPNDGEVQGKPFIQKKMKKKPLIPIIGKIFSKKIGSKESHDQPTRVGGP